MPKQKKKKRKKIFKPEIISEGVVKNIPICPGK